MEKLNWQNPPNFDQPTSEVSAVLSQENFGWLNSGIINAWLERNFSIAVSILLYNQNAFIFNTSNYFFIVCILLLCTACMFPQEEDDLRKILESRRFQITAYHYGCFASSKTIYGFTRKRKKVKVQVIDYGIFPAERHVIKLTLPEFKAVQEAVYCVWETSSGISRSSVSLFQVEYYLHNPFRKLKIPKVDYISCSMEHIIREKLPENPDLQIDLSLPE